SSLEAVRPPSRTRAIDNADTQGCKGGNRTACDRGGTDASGQASRTTNPRNPAQQQSQEREAEAAGIEARPLGTGASAGGAPTGQQGRASTESLKTNEICTTAGCFLINPYTRVSAFPKGVLTDPDSLNNPYSGLQWLLISVVFFSSIAVVV